MKKWKAQGRATLRALFRNRNSERFLPPIKRWADKEKNLAKYMYIEDYI